MKPKQKKAFAKGSGLRKAERGKWGKRDDLVRIHGLHAVNAALANPARQLRRLYATPNALQRLSALHQGGRCEQLTVTPQDLDKMLGSDTVHQGVLVEAAPLDVPPLGALHSTRLLIFLDQVTDPHNVGAILRSAAAFGADGLVMTARHSPPLEGTLAKSASGALEHVPVVLVPNLARALAETGEMGFRRLGLDSEADGPLESAEPGERCAIVLGAEDRGLRRLTREHCDAICALTTFGAIASLNVSNAAAIALHMLAHKLRAHGDPVRSG